VGTEGERMETEASSKVKVLLEALPYLRQFYGKTIVVKIGGTAFKDPELLKSIALDIVFVEFLGIRTVIVHGGGPQIGSLLQRLGLESRFFRGLRITDASALEVVEMVLLKTGKEIVTLIELLGGMAIGISGRDAGLFLAKQMGPVQEADGEEVDLGFVGDIGVTNPSVVSLLLKERLIPVISPIGIDNEGTPLNLNADTVASRLAGSLHAEKLILMTDVEGLLDENGMLISSLKSTKAKGLIESGTVTQGMIPKLSCCTDALDQGVRKTHIINGKIKNALLLELFTESGIGTEIKF
jgi:acetylglutamate kinase